jgi:hypothetical protein
MQLCDLAPAAYGDPAFGRTFGGFGNDGITAGDGRQHGSAAGSGYPCGPHVISTNQF